MKSQYLAFACFVLGLASAQVSNASYSRVAIDPSTGDNYILDSEANPKGEILILNDFDPAYSAKLAILDAPSATARFEMGLCAADRLAYLVNDQGYWTINQFVRVAGNWERQPDSSGLAGGGEAHELSCLPDGRMTLVVGSEVKLIESTQGAKLRVLEIIPAEKYEASLKKAAVKAGLEANLGGASLAQNQNKSQAQNNSGPNGPGGGGMNNNYDSGNGVGFEAGLQGGLGFAYRRHFANQWGFGVAGAGFGGSSNVAVDTGITIFYTLGKGASTRFFALTGASVFYSGSNTQDYSQCTVPGSGTCVPTTVWTSSTLYNFGVGLGMEFGFASNMAFSLEVPFTAIFSSNLTLQGVYPIPNIALIYYF